MTINPDDYINPIDTTNKEYWFIRTDGGEHFNTFYRNEFIGIGWNEITLEQLRTLSEAEIKQLIQRNFVNPEQERNQVQYSERKIRTKVTTILNKIKNFNKLKQGDVVIIPSGNSYELAFGIVQDEQPFQDFTRTDGCAYAKRRRVDWIKKAKSHELDAKFAYIKTTKHAISKINKKLYAPIINNTIFQVYQDNRFGNISVRIEFPDDIDYFYLKDLIDGLIQIGRIYEEHTGIEIENEEDVFIKLNLQSKGFFNLKKQGPGLIFALGLLATSCAEGVTNENIQGTDTETTITELNIPRDTIVKATKAANELRANITTTRQNLENN